MLLTSDAAAALSVRGIAAQVGLSQFHFIRQFAALFGTTPHQLRTEARLERAKALLTDGVPVTRVCFDVGFTSLGSFSSLFAKRVGAPPVKYRTLVQVAEQLERARRPPLVIPGCFGALTRLPPRNSREARLP